MGNSDSKADNVQERESEGPNSSCNAFDLAQKTSQRVYKLTRNLVHLRKEPITKQLQQQINSITYDLPEAPLPLCLNSSLNYFQCKTCFPEDQALCKQCYRPNDHQLHNIGIDMNKLYKACACGNEQVQKGAFRCQNHPLKRPMENEDTVNLFKTEVKYLFDLLFFLRDKPEEDKDTSEKLGTVGRMIIQHIHFLCKKNNIAAKLIFEIVMEKPCSLELGEEKVGKVAYRTILEELINYAYSMDMLNIVKNIIQCILRTDARKEPLIEVYYTFLTRADKESVEVGRMFQSTALKPINFPQSYLRYFLESGKSINLAVPPMDHGNLDLVYQKHRMLLNELEELIRHEEAYKLFMKVFEDTSVVSLLDYEDFYINNNEAKESINQLGNSYVLVLNRIVRIIAQEKTEAGKTLIVYMANSCLKQVLLRESQTFNRSFERIFARLVFDWGRMAVPKKKDFEKVFGKLELKDLVRLIIHFVDFKNIFQQEYSNFITNKEFQPNEHKYNVANLQLVALDDIYLKILVGLLDQTEMNFLYQQYVEEKLGELTGMNQLRGENLYVFLRKLSECMRVFLVSLPCNVGEIVVSMNTKLPSKDSYIIVSNICHLLQNTDSARFKQIAEKFLEHEESIIDFIKHETTIENKKIKYKNEEVKNQLYISPESDYLPNDVEIQTYDKLCGKIKTAEKDQKYIICFEDSVIKPIYDLWVKCSEAMGRPGFDPRKNQKEQIANLEVLCNLYHLTRSKEMLALIEIFSAKIQMPPPKLQVYLKYIVDRSSAEKRKMQMLQDKKAKRLEQLREKQQKTLHTFVVEEEEKIDLECIFCKNADEGQPYLLAHFKYNNFYSSKILEMDMPFLEFTTCGHSAHQKCLREMHKGQFRLWYPCILCKSITNTLLPWATAQIQDKKRYQKIIDFLKNFAANYTFYFQEKKHLLEFGPEDVKGAYRMLIKTIVYSLTIYPLVNNQYFRQKQFPILKFIYDLLVFTQRKAKSLTFEGSYPFKKTNDLTNIFHYHHYQLQFNIINNLNNIQLQTKIDQYKDCFSEEMIQFYDEIYDNLSGAKDKFECQLKFNPYQDMIKGLIFKPPHDLFQLRQLKKKCRSCEYEDQHFEMCLLCDWACCQKCIEVRKHHSVEEHLGESVFLKGSSGQYTYLHEGLSGSYSSIYVDYLGNEADGKTAVKEGEFTLKEVSWNKVLNDIVCDRLHKEVYRKKPRPAE